MRLATHRYADLTDAEVECLCLRPSVLDGAVLDAVAAIEAEVRAGGDAALHALNARFDTAVDVLRVPAAQIQAAWQAATPAFRAAVETAAANIRAFHAPQRPAAYAVEPLPGVRLWREVRPVERVGLYVPGGTAPLVSTLLMTAIPAQLAGCPRIAVCTPPPAAEAVLAVAAYLGVDEVYQVGGAQAVFALAYGTATMPRVDLIAGPGNAYVAAAKWRASRVCAVDMVAGPSEVLVIADARANPAWLAADLLSQAEHGADSQAVLVATDAAVVDAVQAALDGQLAGLPRRDTARAALAHSFAVVVDTLAEAVAFSDRYAPEHLILHLDEWQATAAAVTHAGSVFCGPLTPESAGDYASGTNHTLPTAGFARSTSGLSVERFLRTVTFQSLDADGLAALAPAITTLARAEGLEGHARAVDLRLDGLTAAPPAVQVAAAGLDVDRLLRPHLRQFAPYTSARSEFDGDAAVFLDANENPLGSVGAEGLNRYPDPLQRALKAKLAAHLDVQADSLVLGNGSDEVIDLLVRAFCEPGRDRVLVAPPTYGMYRVSAALNGVAVVEVPLAGPDFALDAAAVVAALGPEVKLVFLCSPNNPTGNALDPAVLARVLDAAPGLVVVDEAYGDFAPGRSVLPLLARRPNLVVLRTFSKAWGLAGLRLGVLVAHPDIAAALTRIKPPYNVGALPQQLALRALDRADEKDRMVEAILAERTRLAEGLGTLPVVERVFPSDANFLLVRVRDADGVYAALCAQGIVVRNRTREAGCAGCLRITVGTRAENDRLLAALAALSSPAEALR